MLFLRHWNVLELARGPSEAPLRQMHVGMSGGETIGAGVEGVRMFGAGVGMNGALILGAGIGMYVLCGIVLARRLTRLYREPWVRMSSS